MKNLTSSPVWQALSAHHDQMKDRSLSALFADDPDRFEKFSLSAAGLFFDYSKNHVTTETMSTLIALVDELDLQSWIERMFGGDAVNNTESRAALHTALRNRSDQSVLVDGADVMPEVRAALAHMRSLSEAIRNGDWKGFTGKRIENIVNIGIGGSDLGPKLVCAALCSDEASGLRTHFVSNMDPQQIDGTLADLDPETTLFVVVSKTFTTDETISNATTARQWLVNALGSDDAVGRHFVAISTASEKVSAFGIDADNMIGFWDWVGGRYSVWSAVGFSIAVALGMDKFESFLSGAHAMDEHFRTAPLAENLPVVSALLGLWYANFWAASSRAMLPYDLRLKELPDYLQQLEMESNGKQVTRSGAPVDFTTSPVVWGGPGNNGQHAFYQLLHQGTRLVPAEFIAAINTSTGNEVQHDKLLANCIAQTEALMVGRDADQVRKELSEAGWSGDELEQAIPHRVMYGNRPSSLVLYDTLTPEILGALLAFYEHRVFVQSVCWGINPFDQWGVELGKQMAGKILPQLTSSEKPTGHDSSTAAIIDFIHKHRRRGH